MAYHDKTTKTWTGRVRLTGLPASVKKGFRSKSEAVAWEAKEKDLLRSPADQAYSFFQIADSWLLACQQRSIPTTCQTKANIANKFLAHLQSDLPIKSVTPILVEGFLNSIPGQAMSGSKTRMASGKTANRYRRELHSLFQYAVKMGALERNPVRAIERYKEDRFRRYVPPASDVKAVISAATGIDREILVFAYHTLARSGEIRNCRWSDIDMKAGTITIWTSKTHDGNPQDDTIEMTEGLRRLLESMPRRGEFLFAINGEQVTRHYPESMMARLCQRAGVKRFTLHCIRHHVAALLSYRLSLMEVSKILRHRNLTTTDIYLRSMVKIETKGIKVLDDIEAEETPNVVPFLRAVK